MDLNAEALTQVDQSQLCLSAFLIRKRDGKCATLFAGETFSAGQWLGGEGGVYGCTAHTEFNIGNVISHEAYVYSRGCNCQSRSRRDEDPPSPELKDINLFPCSCGAGIAWKVCGLSIGMQKDYYGAEEGIQYSYDDDPPADTVQRLLQKLRLPQKPSARMPSKQPKKRGRRPSRMYPRMC